MTDETLRILDELGVEAPGDMNELDDGDINIVCSTLKKLLAKRFRKALDPTYNNSRRPSAPPLQHD